jgi:hypothetical protein
MVHRDLSFSALSTLKHAVMVYRSRSTQTLYVSTPFLPGAKSPTLTQALLGQIITAYLEALARDNSSGKPGGEEGDGDKDSRGGENDTEDRGGPGPSSGTKRKGKGKEPDRRSSKRAHMDTTSDDGQIPVATLSATEQVALSKVSPSMMCSGLHA